MQRRQVVETAVVGKLAQVDSLEREVLQTVDFLRGTILDLQTFLPYKRDPHAFGRIEEEVAVEMIWPDPILLVLCLEDVFEVGENDIVVYLLLLTLLILVILVPGVLVTTRDKYVLSRTMAKPQSSALSFGWPFSPIRWPGRGGHDEDGCRQSQHLLRVRRCESEVESCEDEDEDERCKSEDEGRKGWGEMSKEGMEKRRVKSPSAKWEKL